MKIQANEIAKLLRQEIASYSTSTDTAHTGTVIEVGDGIARIHGLNDAMSGEMLEFECGATGQVFNLEEDFVGAAVFGEFEKITEGSTVKATGKLLEVPVGSAMLGRVVDALGRPVDGIGPIDTTDTRTLESPTPGIPQRQPVDKPLQTGITAIDSMTAIGRGQRELIIGDRKTGKTTIAVDTIINQKGKNVICVYVAVGQKESTIAAVVDTLRRNGAMEYAVVVQATSSDSAAMQYVAPYCGCAIAEHFMYTEAADTLVVYDDLSKQAVAYRQLSLLLRRPPGREAYPGDVFYLHSRLLERSAKLVEKHVLVAEGHRGAFAEASDALNAKVYVGGAGLAEARSDAEVLPTAGGKPTIARVRGTGGSMTALPIIETLEGEVSAYIPTNVISITDGQIYLEPKLFFAGVRPAVNVGISVSRVGGKAQLPAMKRVAGSLRLDLAAFRELEAFSQLGTELDASAQKQLDRGSRLVELLKQPQNQPVDVIDQVVSLFAGTRGFLDKVPMVDVRRFVSELLNGLHSKHAELLETIASEGDLSKETVKKLESAISTFAETFIYTKTAVAETSEDDEDLDELEQAARELGLKGASN